MNLQYTDPGISWNAYDTRIDTFQLTLSSGYASQQALDDLFSEIEDTASVHFYGITDPDKFPVVYDLSKISSNSSLAIIRLMARVGKGYRDPTPFGATDYWNVYGGKCGPYSGGTLQASQVIANALNDFYAPYGCAFFTNIVTAGYFDLDDHGWIDLNGSDATPNDFIVDYNTFRFKCWEYGQYGDPEEYDCDWAVGYPDCENFDFSDIHCLAPNEMNFYFDAIRNVYDSFLSEQLNPFLQHNSSDIEIEFSLCLDITEWWNPEVSFGVPNPCTDPQDYPTNLPPCYPCIN